jgi:hypothetical protein
VHLGVRRIFLQLKYPRFVAYKDDPSVISFLLTCNPLDFYAFGCSANLPPALLWPVVCFHWVPPHLILQFAEEGTPPISIILTFTLVGPLCIRCHSQKGLKFDYKLHREGRSLQIYFGLLYGLIWYHHNGYSNMYTSAHPSPLSLPKHLAHFCNLLD